MISFCVILSLVWLRDQIVNGGGPEWLENVQDEQLPDVSYIQTNNILLWIIYPVLLLLSH